MVTQFGMSEEIGTIYLGSDQEVFVGMEFGQSREYSEEVAAKIDREVSRMLEKCYNKALALLRANKDKMDLLTEALLSQETLNRAEFVALMDEGKLPEGSKEDKPRTVKEILAESATGSAPAEAAAEAPAAAGAPEAGAEQKPEEGHDFPLPPEKDDTHYMND